MCGRFGHIERAADCKSAIRLSATLRYEKHRAGLRMAGRQTTFDEITGTPPHHFLACLRMQRAKELLLQSESSITDICLEVGYTSLGSFSTTFRELVGFSPQE